MLAYLIRRGLIAMGTVWAISVISFAIIQLPPGDYVTSYIAQLEATGSVVTQQEAQNMRELYALDSPIYIQYTKWIGQMLRGNFGVSMEWNMPVIDVIEEPLLVTVVLTLVAVLFTWLLAFPIGIYSAVRQYSIGDHAFTFIGLIGLAVPNFLLALVVLYFGFQLEQFLKGHGVNVDLPIGGLFSAEYVIAPWSMARVWDLAKHLPLPAMIVGAAGTAQLVRILRANLLDELRKPYVVTARAKGLAEWLVLLKYPVRLALNPFVSTVGYTLPLLVSGSIIVSIVLSLPTVGPILLKALKAQDMFLAGTIVLLIGVMTVIGTLISDLLLVWIDPRIRLQK